MMMATKRALLTGLANGRIGQAANVRSIGLLFILVLAAALRLYDLDGASLWFDEAASWYQASQPFSGVIASTA